MCDSDLDSILSYLSSKVNRIFCDREFVGCVKEDFDVLIQNTDNKCCVLFPKLKPIFLKVLRYQAAIFDLSVFYVGYGPKQVAVVCRKEFLKHSSEPTAERKVAKAMNEVKGTPKSPIKRPNKSSRPTQSYYVPPAQRSSVQKNCSDNIKSFSKKPSPEPSSKYKEGKKLPVAIESLSDKNVQHKISKSNANVVDKMEEICKINEPPNENESVECLRTSKPLPLKNSADGSVNGKRYSFDSISECTTDKVSEHQKLSQCNPNDDEPTRNSIPSVKNSVLDNNVQQTSSFIESEVTPAILNSPGGGSANIENLCGGNLDLQNLSAVLESPMQELLVDSHAKSKSSEDKGSESCENILSLENSEELERITQFLKSILIETNKGTNLKSPGAKEELNKEALEQNVLKNFQIPSNDNTEVHKELQKDDVHNFTSDGINVNNNINTIEEPKESTCKSQNLSLEKVLDKSNCAASKSLYISYCDDSTIKTKTADCDIDNENAEMQRAIENMNRKTRPIIKHIRNDNTLRINDGKRSHLTTCENKKIHRGKFPENDKDNNLSSWEDMFDENGDLQPEYVEEIAERIGCDVKVVKANHDYSAYQNAKYQDLEHVIELYDFPSTFKTQDLIQLYKGASQDPMYVKWCDDTHALLVLSSPAQAQRALQIEHDMIKTRPLIEASAVASITASNSDLKPAMKRPQTNMQTARRLINTHLGTKSTLSKEEVEQERQALRDAREQRRQERQNEKDAWEGRPHNTKL